MDGGAQGSSGSAAASTSERVAESSSSSYGASASASADVDDNGGGAKVWVLVLLFSLIVLMLLPSAVRRGGTGGRGSGYQRGGITLKSGWDVVNLCLVLFAILCGLLGRGGGARDGDGESHVAAAAAEAKNHRSQVSPATATEQGAEAAAEPSTEDVWASFNNSATNYSNHNAHKGIRRLKSTSSYPELRMDSDGVWGLESPELAWRSYDDAELYRTRRQERPERTSDVDQSLRRTPEMKTIPVDTYEVRKRLPPQEARRRKKGIERLPKMAEVEEERTHLTEAPARSARSRTWSPEELNTVLEQDTPAEVASVARRRRRSIEKLPEMEEEIAHPTKTTAIPARSRTWSPEELDTVLDQEMPAEVLSSAPLPPPPLLPRRRRHSVENLPRMDEIVEEIQNPRSSLPVRFPPGTPPPPPPPPPPATSSRSKKKRSGSVGGAKELASAIALFYQKKRKSIIMKRERHNHNNNHHHHHLSDDHYSPPSSEASASPDATVRTNAPPPPPLPPPPSSIFSNLFKNRGSKSRRIHSLAPPQPPPPPPPTHRSRKPPHPPSRPAPPTPPLPPVRTRPPRAHPQQPSRPPGYPLQPPIYSRRVVYYPLPPPSPPLAPPPPPPPMSEGEEDAPSVTASPAPGYCASPDVNAKAETFIERFRAGLKLEKINSYREKLQIQEGVAMTIAEEDGEFMVIGSLFEDDDDISLPETPAAAAIGL